MMSKQSGVAAEIIKLEPKALATHCHCHSLNLSARRTTAVSTFEKFIDTVRQICILVKYPPKREKLLGNIQDNIKGEYIPFISCVQQDGLSVQIVMEK